MRRAAHSKAKAHGGGGCASAHSQTDGLVAGGTASGRVWGAVPAEIPGETRTQASHATHPQAMPDARPSVPVVGAFPPDSAQLQVRVFLGTGDPGTGVHGQLHSPLSGRLQPPETFTFSKLESVSLASPPSPAPWEEWIWKWPRH